MKKFFPCKFLFLTLVIVLILGCFSSCGPKDPRTTYKVAEDSQYGMVLVAETELNELENFDRIVEEVVYVGMSGPSETETFITSNRQINLNTRSTMLQIPLKDGIVAVSYKISIYTKDGYEVYTNSEAIFDMNGNRIQKVK